MDASSRMTRIADFIRTYVISLYSLRKPGTMPHMNRLLCLLSILLLGSARSELIIEGFDGPVTQKEIAAFKDHIRTVNFRGDNNHNNFVYGTGGNVAEALGAMYDITHDREILDLLVGVA